MQSGLLVKMGNRCAAERFPTGLMAGEDGDSMRQHFINSCDGDDVHDSHDDA